MFLRIQRRFGINYITYTLQRVMGRILLGLWSPVERWAMLLNVIDVGDTSSHFSGSFNIRLQRNMI